mmetsp:Transcript_13186/g.18376  ORF Transcript_13186/g.18376 Transcript_13186/m.18376 type:complete len:309 (-) Transcript_13186:94-1020(-)
MDFLPPVIVSFLTANFDLAPEMQSFWMAFQGAMAVRNGPNKKNELGWFHAFLLSALSSYGGAMFAFLWMGKPTSMLTNDLNAAACIIAFVLANYTPFDIGYKLGNSLPIVLVTTCFAQLFRSQGVIKFSSGAFEALKDSPSAYYPIPVVGPILNATLLGNMTGFFFKGFNDYVKNGMPWPFQNGLFCASFYHFYVHDDKGFIGKFLREKTLLPMLQGEMDTTTFGVVVVGIFMQIVGLLQLPLLLGPTFSPFTKAYSLVASTATKKKPSSAPRKLVKETPVETPPGGNTNGTATKKKRKRNKKKTKQS